MFRRLIAIAAVPAFAHAQVLELERADFERALGLELRSTEDFPEESPEEYLVATAEETGVPLGLLRRNVIFRTKIVHRDGTFAGFVIAVPAGAPLSGCHVTLAMSDRGKYLACGVHGEQEIDEDPTRRWTAFLSALPRRGVFAAGPRAEVAAYRRALRRLPAADRRTAAALRELQAAMDLNSAFGWLGGPAKEQRRLVDPRHARTVEVAMRKLGRHARALEGLLGKPQAAEYGELSKRLADHYRDYATADRKRPYDELTAGLQHRLCGACHDARTASGRTFQRALANKLERFAVPDPPLRVGFHIRPAFGDDGRASQAIVDALRAAAVLIHKHTE